jgi:SAM-dependent methyltransferase
MRANCDRWDELVAIHARSAFYDVPGFKAGKTSLRPIEMEELGDVAGKSLLHLQCHFGLDSLSWARRGARVTGVDYSENAIALARSLNDELRLGVEFLCSNVYDLPDGLDGRFDIVFTSYGAICWLPDLPRWGQLAARYLKPGGTFYMVEIHPTGLLFDDRKDVREPRVGYPYFPTPEPIRSESEGTYADRSAAVRHRTSFCWVYTMADVLNALIGAGLRIEFLHEFPYCVCPLLPCMAQHEDGWWYLQDPTLSLPFLFSVKATK